MIIFFDSKKSGLRFTVELRESEAIFFVQCGLKDLYGGNPLLCRRVAHEHCTCADCAQTR